MPVVAIAVPVMSCVWVLLQHNNVMSWQVQVGPKGHGHVTPKDKHNCGEVEDPGKAAATIRGGHRN